MGLFRHTKCVIRDGHHLRCHHRFAMSSAPRSSRQCRVIHLRWSSGTVIPKGKGHPLRRLKIRLHCKFKLINKNWFKRRDIVLLVEEQHSFFVVNGIYCSEGDDSGLFARYFSYWLNYLSICSDLSSFWAQKDRELSRFFQNLSFCALASQKIIITLWV